MVESINPPVSAVEAVATSSDCVWSKVTVRGLPVFEGRVLTAAAMARMEFPTSDSVATFAQRLRGQFGIVLRSDQRTILIRDSFGSYPLYFRARPTTTQDFSDSASALADDGTSIGSELSSHSLLSLFALGNLPDEQAVYEGIQCLRPGSILDYERGQVPHIKTYFSLSDLCHLPVLDAESVKEELLARCEEYLRPVCEHIRDRACILFSSGVDSALNVEFVKAVNGGDIPDSFRAYCFDYPRLWRRRYSEFSDAQRHASVLGIPLRPVRIDGRSFHRSASAVAHRARDFPYTDRATVLERVATREIVDAGQQFIFTGFNADVPFCGHPWMLDNCLKHSEVFTGVASPMTAEELARNFGVPNPSRVDYLRPLLASCHLRGEELDEWIANYKRRLTEYWRPIEGIDYMRAQQLATQQTVAHLWTNEFLEIEEELGVTFISPFMDIEVAKLGYQLPLADHFRGGETKAVLRELLKERTGLRPMKRAMPIPNRMWSMMPTYSRYVRQPRHRMLCRWKYAKNVSQRGKNYALLHQFYIYASWLENLATAWTRHNGG